MAKGKGIALIIVIAVVTIGVTSWHDGLFGTTEIRDINQGDLAVGTAVTIKGELTARLGNFLTVSSDDYGVGFIWEGTAPPLHSIVVVRGLFKVSSHSLMLPQWMLFGYFNEGIQ